MVATDDTPIFRAYESREIAQMFVQKLNGCYEEAPSPWGIPLLLSKNHMLSMLRDCLDFEARGGARVEEEPEPVGPPSASAPEPPMARDSWKKSSASSSCKTDLASA